MKIIFLFAAFIQCLNAFSQNATIKGSFDTQEVKRKLILSRPLHPTQFPEVNEHEEIIVDKGKFNAAITLQQPEIMYLTSRLNDSLEFRLPIFLKEGYAIKINFTTKNGKPQLTVTGKGAQDNQPWVLIDKFDLGNYPKDTLPARILADLKKVADKNWQSLNQYISSYHPSPDFIKSWNVELQYTPIRIYFIYAKQRKPNIREAYNRNKKIWHDSLDQMFIKAPLINEAALASSSYRIFLKMFLILSTPQIWEDESAIAEFEKFWYGNDSDTGSRSFFNDGINIPNQKIIEKYFTGKVKEYMYAHLFKMALESGKIANIDAIYKDFSKAYPFSPYKKVYDKPVAAVIKSLIRLINDKMIFLPNSIKTWAAVLELFKGKTVLVDMWGTWCGPCRDEMKRHSAAIKSYFKDKPLDYLYIANQDQENKIAWKSLITYYNLEGHHILSTHELTSDITENIKLEGYPTYVIIHKDGSFELSKAGAPLNKEILIAQIEEALK